MYKTITSTELKQKTREIISMVSENNEPVIISTYSHPRIMLVPYKQKKKTRKINSISDLRKYQVKSNIKSFDSVKYFRKLRED